MRFMNSNHYFLNRFRINPIPNMPKAERPSMVVGSGTGAKNGTEIASVIAGTLTNPN